MFLDDNPRITPMLFKSLWWTTHKKLIFLKKTSITFMFNRNISCDLKTEMRQQKKMCFILHVYGTCDFHGHDLKWSSVHYSYDLCSDVLYFCLWLLLTHPTQWLQTIFSICSTIFGMTLFVSLKWRKYRWKLA